MLSRNVIVSPKAMRWLWVALGVLGGLWLTNIYAKGIWPILPIDFSIFWGAAKRVVEGDAALIYDGAANDLYLAALHHASSNNGLRFPYPPGALLFVWPLAFLSFPVAWVIFLVPGAVAVFYIVRRLTDSVTAIGSIFALGGPIHSIQLGQNGFYTAALLGGGLLALRHNKLVAGIALGLLTLKPHLAVIAFLALLWWREWKAFGIASFVAVILIVIPAITFGPSIYSAYFVGSESLLALLAGKQSSVIETLQQSVFALVLGRLGLINALLVQAMTAVLALTISARIEQRDLAIAAVIASTLLFAPYLFLYDSTMLVVAAAILIRLESGLAGPLALVIGITGTWFWTLGSIVPVAALSILAMAFLLAHQRDSNSRQF